MEYFVIRFSKFTEKEIIGLIDCFGREWIRVDNNQDHNNVKSGNTVAPKFEKIKLKEMLCFVPSFKEESEKKYSDIKNKAIFDLYDSNMGIGCCLKFGYFVYIQNIVNITNNKEYKSYMK